MVVPVLLILGLSGVLFLHFAEPDLSITWSYAHLGRATGRWLLGGLALFVLPPVFWYLGTRSAGRQPLSSLPGGWVGAGWLLLAFLLLSVVFLGAAFLVPTPWMSMDSQFLLERVSSGEGENARWHLLLKFHQLSALLLREVVGPVQSILALNSLMAGVTILSLLGSVSCLARNRFEAIALGALVCTTFGIVQLCVGHSDIYTMPLAVTALYAWLALESMRGRLHPAWPAALAGLGPFVYLGLALLAPSVLVLLAVEWRRPAGRRRCAIAVAWAVATAGTATLPGFGVPFAFGEYYAAVQHLAAASMGLNPEGYHVPWTRMLSPEHLVSVFHLMLLVDPVGWVLLLVCTPRLLVRPGAGQGRVELVFLLLLVVPYLAFMIAMDPLYGAYADWTLYSYGAVGTALLGGFAFVRWASDEPRIFGALLGLALAVSSVHLLAKFHALDVGSDRHFSESPAHLYPERP